VFAVATVASVVAPRIAHAQVIPEFPPPVALDPFDSGARAPTELRAADAFERGAALAAANRFHEAALAFEESYAAVPRPSTLYDIGQTYRASGESMRAIGAYRRYLALASMSPARRAAVSATITDLESRLATVSIRTTPADAEVTVDGAHSAVGTVLRVDAGRHALAVRARGYHPFDQVFRIRPNENRDLVVSLDRRPLSQQPWFWVVLSAAVTSVALTTTAIVLAVDHEPANCGTLNVCTNPR
jgi:hypothetical protein